MKSKNYILVRAAVALLLTLLSSTGAMPELTYADGYVSITSNSPSTTLSWPIENLQKLTFENTSTAIRDVRATGLDLHSEKFDAYDLSGKMVKKQIKSLSELPRGVYIVKDGSVTIKVVRK